MSNISKLQHEMGARFLPPQRPKKAKVFYEVATIENNGTITSRNFAKIGKAKTYYQEQQAKGLNVQPIAKYKGEEFLEEIF